MAKKPKVYRGELVNGKPVVYADNEILKPTRGEKIVTYSADGFGWGGRRGSAQLALSILLDYFDDVERDIKEVRKLAVMLHIEFQWEFLVNVESVNFEISSAQIDEFLKKRSITPW